MAYTWSDKKHIAKPFACYLIGQKDTSFTVMEINKPSPTSVPPRLIQSLTRNWQLGQFIQATVTKQTTPSTVILQIGKLQIPASSSSPLPVGLQLSAEVIKLGHRPILQLQMKSLSSITNTIPSNNAPQRIELQLGMIPIKKAGSLQKTTTPSPIVTPLEHALKQLMPKQTSMSALLANVVWINSGKAAALALPPVIAQLSKELLNSLPEKARINQPGVLKRAILNSGVFLENKLVKLAVESTNQGGIQHLNQANHLATGKIDTDLKVALLRLANTIKQVIAITPKQTQSSPALNASLQQTMPAAVAATLPNSHPQPQASVAASLANISNVLALLQELGKQAESSLARTQLHQMASTTTAADSNINQWALELPIRNNQQVDIFDILITDEENQADEDEEKHRWSVSLAFDLPGLGPVHTKLQLINNKIVTTFWAERIKTRALFSEHQDELLKRYRENGVETAGFHCFQGSPPASSKIKQTRLMLDIKA